ncbi:MAG: prepilin-type N-terminal cleavage/methylation domain-containing protein [Deltaproteobacteria bacterium]|nr:prepilin-type N-terminal cleavage/methylation domain-containing protein [Deltaproteobacteria bacterium]
MKKTGNRGFTLIELMIALALGGIVSAAVYTTYKSQLDSYVTQEAVAVMQQNLRAAMFIIGHEVRNAGVNPTQGANTFPVAASPGSFQFAADLINNSTGAIGSDGLADDTITYNLVGDVLCRNGVEVARNIDALSFVYFDGTINDGEDSDEDGIIDELGEGTISLVGDIRTIAAVQVTLVARSDRADPKFLNNTVYTEPITNNDLVTAPGDHFRRRMLSAVFKVRNYNLPGS